MCRYWVKYGGSKCSLFPMQPHFPGLPESEGILGNSCDKVRRGDVLWQVKLPVMRGAAGETKEFDCRTKGLACVFFWSLFNPLAPCHGIQPSSQKIWLPTLGFLPPPPTIIPSLITQHRIAEEQRGGKRVEPEFDFLSPRLYITKSGQGWPKTRWLLSNSLLTFSAPNKIPCPLKTKQTCRHTSILAGKQGKHMWQQRSYCVSKPERLYFEDLTASASYTIENLCK